MFSISKFIFFFAGIIAFIFHANAQKLDSPNSTASKILVDESAISDTGSVLLVIGDIKITGYKKTKLYIIQREIPFKTGDNILQSDLDKKIELCRQQLMNTALFVDVEVNIARQQGELVFIDIHVKERWYLFPVPYFKVVDRNLNQWLVEHKGSLQRINYGLKFTQYNVSGRNDKFYLWLINGYTQQFSLRYDNPNIDNTLKNGINFGLSYSRNREINYATNPASGKQSFLKDENQFLRSNFHIDIGYTYRPAIKTRHTFKLTYVDEKVNDTVFVLNPSYFNEGVRNARYAAFSYSVSYFNVDYIPYPLKGIMGDAYFYKKGFSSNMNVWQLGARATYTHPIILKSYLQFQAAGLLKFPFKQPFYNQGMFGGNDFYMRGYEYHVIDGVAGGFGRATAIKQILSIKVNNPVKIKGHDKIPLRILIKAYGDAGYSYNPNNNKSILNNRVLKTWGAGIDILSFYDIVLKLEYSYNQLGKHGLFIHSKSDF